jgi:hypothetical protein
MTPTMTTSPADKRATAAILAARTSTRSRPHPGKTSKPDWKPEPCPLTREELRRIIIRQIG